MMNKCSQIRVTESQFQRFLYSVIRKMLDLLQKRRLKSEGEKKEKREKPAALSRKQVICQITITITCVVAPIFDV